MDVLAFEDALMKMKLVEQRARSQEVNFSYNSTSSFVLQAG